MRTRILLWGWLAGCSGDEGREPGPEGDVDCAALCEDKSLGCPNDDQCETQCDEFRAVCTAEADAVIACNYERPTSDFECNPVSGTTQVKAGICGDELSAYLECQGS
jgi:hypothetical protein